MIFRDYSKDFLRSARNEVERAVATGAIKIEGESNRLATLKAGPTKTNPNAEPSAPYEPPAVRTGTLSRSITHETFERGSDFFGRIGTNVKYGFWLEVGTSRMLPRPYLRPALDAMRNEIVDAIRRAGRRMRGR